MQCRSECQFVAATGHKVLECKLACQPRYRLRRAGSGSADFSNGRGDTLNFQHYRLAIHAREQGAHAVGHFGWPVRSGRCYGESVANHSRWRGDGNVRMVGLRISFLFKDEFDRLPECRCGALCAGGLPVVQLAAVTGSGQPRTQYGVL